MRNMLTCLGHQAILSLRTFLLEPYKGGGLSGRVSKFSVYRFVRTLEYPWQTRRVSVEPDDTVASFKTIT